MKDDVDLVERGRHRLAIAHVAFDKLRGGIDPCRFAAPMRVRLEVIQHADFPAFAQKQIGHVRTDQPCAASDECAFLARVHVLM